MNKINEIKNRLAATTPGVWSFSIPQYSLASSPPPKSIQVQTEGGEFYVKNGEIELSREDVEFMAQARQDIAYLLRLVECAAESIPVESAK